MCFQIRVINVEGSKPQFIGCLNNRIFRSVEIDSGIREISAAELMASDVEGAILAIPDEDRTFNWSDYHGAVLQLIDKDLEIEFKRLRAISCI